jgi:HlyD family type I secretion membrane fusion protein
MAIGNRPASGGALTTGFLAILLFFGVFGGWAATAPLESAVVAPGVVASASQRKTIQHLEGGIIRDILVRDGDRVTAGQVLLRLDSTQADTRLELLRRRKDISEVRQARLIAERDNRDAIEMPKSFATRQSDPAIAELLSTQADILRERRELLKGQIALQESARDQLQAQIVGLEETVAAQTREHGLLQGEIAGLQELFNKQLVPKARLLELQRRKAELEGNRSQNAAALQRAHQATDEALLRIAALKSQTTNEAAANLDEVRSTLLDLEEQIRAAEDIRSRVAVTAPHAGTVLNLGVHTPGGVVAPGERLLELVPLDDRLIIEARVDPQDKDVVHVGLEANIRITAFNQRYMNPLKGRVTNVSADRLEDKRTAEPYYAVRIELLDSLDILNERGDVTPGMGAEVIIVAGKRTLMSYLTDPLALILRRSLLES